MEVLGLNFHGVGAFPLLLHTAIHALNNGQEDVKGAQVLSQTLRWFSTNESECWIWLTGPAPRSWSP